MEHLLKEVEASGEQVAGEDSLRKITEYADSLLVCKEEIADMESKLAEKKKVANKLEQELIPESMLAVNMTSFQLASGKTVSIKEQLSCSVKDYDLLYDFLEERGDDAIMKIAIELGKLPKSILELVIKHLQTEFDLSVEHKMYIHPQTLKAYFTRLCGIGSEEPSELPLGKLDENMVGTFTYYKTVVK